MRKCFWFSIIFLFLSIVSYPQWINQSLPDSLSVILGIDFIDQNSGITGGWFTRDFISIEGKEFYTNNAGQTWIQALTPDSLRVIVEVQMINDSLCYGAGAYNITTDKHLCSPEIKTIFSQLTPRQKSDTQIGINLLGDEDYRGYFVESTDAGISWQPKASFDDSVYYLTDMSFYNQDTGIVVAISAQGSANAILKTIDGGSSWNYIYPFFPSLKIEKAKIICASTIVAVGELNNAGVILISNDGGEHWLTKTHPEFTWITGVTYFDSLNIIISANLISTAGVYRSSDGGKNWSELKSYNSPPHLINGVNVFKNSEQILAFGTLVTPGFSVYGSFIDVSQNGGNSWNYSEVLIPYISVSSKMIDNQKWFLTGTIADIFEGFVLYTQNGSALPVELTSFIANSNGNSVILNWETATELNNNGFEVQKLINEDFITIGFIQGNGTTSNSHSYSYSENNLIPSNYSYRLKQIDFDGSFEYSKIVEINMLIPSKFDLSQNYPNPFNPTTKIKFQLAEDANTKLKIYDLLGNEVATLVDEFKPAGNYDVTFNAFNISSGIYYYSISAGSFVQTKKMILMK
ncbi:MAG: T9SS type A sorting domain-containing protein [Ignavibacteriaceae bacterium]